MSSQFATITHAVEHQFGHDEDEHESCSICIHQINSSDLVTDTSTPINIDFKENEKITDNLYSLNLINHSNNNARSPPLPLF
ncbi:MAG: hypothetical protein ACPHLK_03850 [Gammaproteobacteria bacterium]